jgi:hypothetical protein
MHSRNQHPTQRIAAFVGIMITVAGRVISLRTVTTSGATIVAVAMSVSACGGLPGSLGGGSTAGSVKAASAPSNIGTTGPKHAAFPASVPAAIPGIPTSGVCRMLPLEIVQRILDPTGTLHGADFQVHLKVFAADDSSCAYSEGIWHGRPILRYMGIEYQCGNATQSEIDLAKVVASPVPGTGGVVLGESHNEDQLVKLPGGCVFSALLMPDLRSGHYEPGAIPAMTTAMMYVHSHA